MTRTVLRAEDGHALTIGDRVQLHPASDWWMRGARYGEVVKLGRKYVHVRLDRNGNAAVRFLPRDILELVSP